MARTYKRDTNGRFASTGTASAKAGSTKTEKPGAGAKPKASRTASKPKPPSKPAAAAKTGSKRSSTPKAAKAPPKAAKAPPKAKAATTRKTAASKPAASKAKAQPNSQPDGKTATGKPAGGATKRKTLEGGKEGVMSGRVVRDASIRNTLRREENRIKGSGVENAVLISRRGRLVYRGTDNNPNGVTPGKRGVSYGDKVTMTHNHPEAGNPGYNPKIRGSRLTAGLSGSDISVGVKRYAREIRAVGETRAYSFKPDYIKVKNVGVVPKQGKTFQDDIRNAYATGRDRAIRARMKVESQFNSRIDAAKKQWWNPIQRAKVSKLTKMKARSMAAMEATYHFQEQANSMRALRGLGYNITARRNRTLQPGKPAKRSRWGR